MKLKFEILSNALNNMFSIMLFYKFYYTNPLSSSVNWIRVLNCALSDRCWLNFFITFLCLLSQDRHSTTINGVTAFCILNKDYRDFKNLRGIHKHFPKVTSELHKLSVWSAKRFLWCVWVGTDGLVCNRNAFLQLLFVVCSKIYTVYTSCMSKIFKCEAR